MEMDYSPHFYILLALAVISTSEFSVQGFQLPLPNDIDGEDLGKNFDIFNYVAINACCYWYKHSFSSLN